MSTLAGETRGTSAVVIGGWMAGLVSARVLAEHFDQITILEQDRFPEATAPRAGVPQGQHPHALLARGADVLETLFPGLQDELVEAGARRLDVSADFANLHNVGWAPNIVSGITVLSLTRPLLEARVRARVQGHPRVHIRAAWRVTDLLADNVGNITGVAVRRRSTSARTAQVVEAVRADLVVDASGRSSRVPEWLRSLGYSVAEETIVNSFLGYATRLFEPPAGFRAPWQGIYLQYAPPAHLRSGVLIPVEGERWMATLGGLARDHPPTDEAGFLAFARSLRSPMLYDAIKEARPVSPIAGWRGATENRLRHFERLARWPEGFVVVGDAVCVFNPVYGQGMTTAALGALVLDRCLRDQRRRRPTGDFRSLAGRFQRRLTRSFAPAWLLSTAADLRCPATEGGHAGLLRRLMYRCLDRVRLRAFGDPRALRLVLEVYHLRRPIRTLFHPAVLLPTLGGRTAIRNPWESGSAPRT